MHYEKFPDGSVKCIEEEIPFELPEGWEWARLGMICPYGENKAISSNLIDESSWILDLEDIERDTGIIKYHATKIERNSVSNKYAFTSGQLLYSKLRPYLNKVVVAEADGYCTTEILPLTFYGNISVLYMQLYLMSPTFLKYVNIVSYGVKMPRLGTTDGKNSLIAVPPLHEQLRIREQFDVIALLIRKIDKYTESLHNDVSELKSKILDLAIKGRLVPQDPNDEPSSVLLERIKKEKEELIKSGKLKRDKKESVIFKGDDNSYYEKVGDDIRCIDEEVPFELPDSWEYIRLKFAWELVSGRDLFPSEYSSEQSGIPYITGASNFENGQVSLFRWTSVPQVITYKGDLLLTCKGTIGEIALNNFGEAHIARQIMAIRNKYDLNVDFLALCIEYSMSKIKQAAKGLIPGISREDILGLIIPIPPAEQQIEIVRYVHIYRNKLNSILLSLM